MIIVNIFIAFIFIVFLLFDSPILKFLRYERTNDYCVFLLHTTENISH